MLSKGLIGYEENMALGMCTHVSGSYLIRRLRETNKHVDKDYDELKCLFQLFERNIDKDKKLKILEKVRIKNDNS